MIPGWAWFIVAWLAADCAFVLAWTMRATPAPPAPRVGRAVRRSPAP